MPNTIPTQHQETRTKIRQTIESLGDLQCRVMMSEIMDSYEANLARNTHNQDLTELSNQWSSLKEKAQSETESLSDQEMDDLFDASMLVIEKLFPNHSSLAAQGPYFAYVKSFLNQDKNRCCQIMRHSCDYLNGLSSRSEEEQQQYFENFPPSASFMNCLDGTLERVEILLHQLVSSKATLPLMKAHENTINILTSYFEDYVSPDYESHVASYLEFLLGIKSHGPAFTPENQMLLTDAIKAHQDYHKIFKEQLLNQLFLLDHTLEELQNQILPGEFFIEDAINFVSADSFKIINQVLSPFQTNQEGFLSENDEGDVILDHEKIFTAFSNEATPTFDYLDAFIKQKKHRYLTPPAQTKQLAETKKHIRDNILDEQSIRELVALTTTSSLENTTYVFETMWMAGQSFIGHSPILTQGIHHHFAPQIANLSRTIKQFYPKQADKLDQIPQIKQLTDPYDTFYNIELDIINGCSTQYLKNYINKEVDDEGMGHEDLFDAFASFNEIADRSFSARADCIEIIDFLFDIIQTHPLSEEEKSSIEQDFKTLTYYLIENLIRNGQPDRADLLIDKFNIQQELFEKTKLLDFIAKQNSPKMTDYVFGLFDRLCPQDEKELLLIKLLTGEVDVIENATANNNAYFLSSLIKQGFDAPTLFMLQNEVRNQALVITAVDNNAKDVLSLMIAQNVDVISPTDNHELPLYYAIKNNNLEIIDLILKKAIDDQRITELNETFIDDDGNYTTFIATAIQKDFSIILEKLLKAGIRDKDFFITENALHYAADYNALHCVSFLVKQPDIDINAITQDADNHTALERAILGNDAQIIKILIAAGAQPFLETDSDYYIDLASEQTNQATQTALLTSMDNAQNNIFHHYASHNYPLTTPITEHALYQPLTQQNAQGFTPIILALKEKNFIFLTSLLNKIDFMSITDENLENLFHHIAKNHDIESCQNLKEFLDDTQYYASNPQASSQIKTAIFASNHEGNSMIDIALAHNDDDLLTPILWPGILNEITNQHHPLFKAIEKQDSRIINKLLNYDCDINLRIDNYGSFLNKAIELGNLDIVKLLIEKGAKTDQIDNQGQDAMAYAKVHQHEDILHYLEQKTHSNKRPLEETIQHTSSITTESKSPERTKKLKIKSHHETIEPPIEENANTSPNKATTLSSGTQLHNNSQEKGVTK